LTEVIRSFHPRGQRAYRILLPAGLILLVILIARIGPEKMWATWIRADKSLIVGAALLFCLSMMARGIRWSLLLSATPTPLKYGRAFKACALNAFFSNLTPARAGDVLAPLWLGPHGVSPAVGYGVVVVDRLFDIVAVLALFCAAVWNFWRIAPAGFAGYRAIFLFTGLILIAGVLAVVFVLLRLELIIGRLERRPGRILGRVAGALRTFSQALASFRRGRILIAAQGVALSCWLMDLTTFYLIGRSMVPDLSWSTSSTAGIFATVASIPTFIPGGLGVGAAAYTVVMTAIGYDTELIGSAAVLMTLLTHGVRAVLAGLLTRLKLGGN